MGLTVTNASLPQNDDTGAHVYCAFMSGIAGLWSLEGHTLDVTLLSGMSASLRHRGPDGEGKRVSGPVGFACQHLWVTPEEVGEIQPLMGRAGTMLVMDGRLDNRADLLRALDLPVTASDAACALAAYDKWDELFAEQLNGDFVLAVFEPLRRRLLLVRDAIGVRPLYYFRNDRWFAFASEIKALFAHPEIPVRPDDEGIADYMLTSSRPLDRQDITCFAGVSALVPAHLAVITSERCVTRRYWDFDVTRGTRLRSFDEYAEGFRDRFAQAVRRRIRSAYPVAVAVSGGLDSSSIFCQAEELRRSSMTGPALVGLSHPGAEGSDADELKYVLAIEHKYGVKIQQFALEPFIGLAQGAREQICATEAPLIDYIWGRSRELHQRAAASGARVLLTGDWGDQVLFSSAYLVDLFRQFRWLQIWRHFGEYRRWVGPAESRALTRRFGVDLPRHYLPHGVIRVIKWARHRLMDVDRPKPWFSDGFLRRGLRFASRPASIGSGFHSAQAKSIYLEARSKYHVHCLEWHNKIGALHGVDASLPFLDRDLLAFLIAIPGEVQNRNGVPRAILREAMRGVLPEPVRTRRGKADFSYIVNSGVAKDMAVISRALSRDSLGVELGYVDGGRLTPAVARLSAGTLAGLDCGDSWDLADLFGLEVWLQVFFGQRCTSSIPDSRQVRERVG
jgi:asparagine synthase (glutamine-hydrolysing)